MAGQLEEIINRINKLDNPSERRLPLPDDTLIKKYEDESGFIFPDDYKIFLKSVSNAFVGYISPFTLSLRITGDQGDLLTGISDGRKVGVPEDWIPICEDNGDYYCITSDGSIHFWDHNGHSNETWPNLATWMKEVWLEGN